MTCRIAPNVVLLEGELDGICEQCGAKEELRPYGKRLESGRRMRVCFDCAMENEAEMRRAFDEFVNGKGKAP